MGFSLKIINTDEITSGLPYIINPMYYPDLYTVMNGDISPGYAMKFL